MTSYNDRVEGVLLGTAAGDALGAPYEFQPPRGPELEVAMVGGGLWERGEWTDDTSMAIAIAEVAATGADLRDAAAQDAIEPMAGMVTRHQRHWNPNGFGAQSRIAWWPHHGGGRAGRVEGSPSTHRPHGGQRVIDANRAGGACLPRRRGRHGGDRRCDQRADPLRPRRRRRLRAVVLRNPPCGSHR